MIRDTYSIRPRDDFDHFNAAIQASFARALEDGDGALFSTRMVGKNRHFLSDTYLNSFSDPEARRVHTCSACLSFLNRFGNLAVIGKDGIRRSAMFGYLNMDEVPAHFKLAAAECASALANGGLEIVHQFWWPTDHWGTGPSSWHYGAACEYEWRHLEVELPKKYKLADRVRTPGQARSYSKERYGMLSRGLSTLDLSAYEQTVAALKSGAVPAASKFLSMAEERLKVKQQYDALTNQIDRDSFIWSTLIKATEGFTRFTSDALSTMTKGFDEGTDSADVIIRKFNKTVDESVYQVTTAPVKAGNVRQAEDLFAKLGLEPALRRAQVSRTDPVLETFSVWKPTGQPTRTVATPVAAERKGLFAAVLPAQQKDKPMIYGASISMKKLLEDHLPNAVALQVKTDVEGYIGSLTTASDYDAPPLLAWDTAAYRNPYFWYRWPGVTGADFGLTGEWTTVTRVLPLPSQWGETKSHHKGYYLEVEGGAPAFPENVGLALFTEGLAPDLKPVRRTIQAFSAKGTLDPVPDPTVGVIVRDVATLINLTVAVHTASAVSVFTITSWE